MKKNNRITFAKIAKHMMTGVSYMIPVIAMGGILQAFGTMIGGSTVLDNPGTIGYVLFTGGQAAMGLVVPVLAAFIAFSICDRPGIAPGLLVGVLAVNMNIGFIGGIIGGYLVGYFCLLIKKKVKVHSAVKPLMPLLIIPLLGGLFAISLMSIIIGPPLAQLQEQLITLFRTMGTGSNFIFGSTLGALIGIDMAGPIGKIGTTVANGLLADGILGPQGAKICASMVPPLALGFSSVFFNKKKYNTQEEVAGRSALLLGLFQVTEGGLPFLLRDPLRVIPCTAIGAAVTGGLAMIFGVTSPVTMGGIVAFPVMGGIFPGGIISIVVGTAITIGLLAIIKKDVTDEDIVVDEDDDEEFEISIEK